jgi:hypothetical protein
MEGWLMKWKRFGRKRVCINGGAVCFEGLRETTKNLRSWDDLAEIRTTYLPSTSPERYRYSTQFAGVKLHFCSNRSVSYCANSFLFVLILFSLKSFIQQRWSVAKVTWHRYWGLAEWHWHGTIDILSENPLPVPSQNLHGLALVEPRNSRWEASK